MNEKRRVVQKPQSQLAVHSEWLRLVGPRARDFPLHTVVLQECSAHPLGANIASTCSLNHQHLFPLFPPTPVRSQLRGGRACEDKRQELTQLPFVSHFLKLYRIPTMAAPPFLNTLYPYSHQNVVRSPILYSCLCGWSGWRVKIVVGKAGCLWPLVGLILSPGLALYRPSISSFSPWSSRWFPGPPPVSHPREETCWATQGRPMPGCVPQYRRHIWELLPIHHLSPLHYNQQAFVFRKLGDVRCKGIATMKNQPAFRVIFFYINEHGRKEVLMWMIGYNAHMSITLRHLEWQKESLSTSCCI